jgi:hypothetical protein
MVWMTVLPPVALNPTTKRLACGPMVTAWLRTGFHSADAPTLTPQTRQKAAAIAGLNRAVVIIFMEEA